MSPVKRSRVYACIARGKGLIIRNENTLTRVVCNIMSHWENRGQHTIILR